MVTGLTSPGTSPLYLKGASENALVTASVSSKVDLPATYFGAVPAANGFEPRPGMTVVAQVNGVTCGQGSLVTLGGQLLYGVTVAGGWAGRGRLR